MTTSLTLSQALKNRILDPAAGPLVLPGAPNALTARIVEESGFEAVYLSGAGVANTFLGAPDIGLLGYREMLTHIEAVRDAVAIPLVVDGDTGYGNAVTVHHTVRGFEAAGANGIQLEDQKFPKKCGHFANKGTISADEMVAKIHAAVDARRDDGFIIIGRTDALATEGLDAACERAQRYLDAGADVAFVEAPRRRDAYLGIPRRLSGPAVANVVEGGMTPVLPFGELADAGYRVILYANTAMRAAISAMQFALGSLRARGDSLGVSHAIASWSERQRLVRKDAFDALSDAYATDRFTGSRP